ncbi:MAG: cache domain-containing protein, partial [Hyphomicrobiaceae bacterium]
MSDQLYQYEETRELVALVSDATELVAAKGEAAFDDLRVAGSRWRQGETYVFVLDPEGTMLLHPDPALEGRNALDLKDVNGKPIIRGLIEAAAALPDKPEGWYHYQWPVPGGLLPRWKSSYVRVAMAPSGKRYVVGSGVYNDR